MKKVYNKHVGAYGIIIHNGKVVLITKSRGGYLGKLDFPGGGVEHTETPQEALRREVMEEAGVTDFTLGVPSIFDVAVMDIAYSAKKNELEHKHYDINFMFVVKNKFFEISNESIEIKWVTLEEAKKLVHPDDVGMQRMLKKYESWLNKNN